MQTKLYDTLSRCKVVFAPLEGNTARMYTCGPTVYSYAHIGNMRAYIFMDTLRRVLKHAGYNILSVLNITDVGHLTDDGDDGEDKITTAAKLAHKQPLEIAQIYANAFLQDLDLLNITRPDKIVRATDHIPEMLEMCKTLVARGYAYVTDDGVYFDTTRANDYGKLSNDRQGKQAGARVAINQDKRNPCDFAIWKIAAPNHIMKWDSPWGLGYPGWHIECSAMSHKYLGARFDIHTGGIDHIPVHHENEIAQSEAYCGCVPANIWMHNEFMQYEGGKMSKSLGTVFTLSDIVDKGYTPIEFRYFCHTAHYRKKLNFGWSSMDSAKVACARLRDSLLLHRNSNLATSVDILSQFKDDFDNAILDDLNAPLGIGILHSMLKLPHSNDVYNLALQFDDVLGLDLVKLCDASIQPAQVAIPNNIQDLAQARWQAKQAKQYNLADQIRQQLTQLGYTIIDTPNGFELKPN